MWWICAVAAVGTCANEGLAARSGREMSQGDLVPNAVAPAHPKSAGKIEQILAPYNLYLKQIRSLIANVDQRNPDGHQVKGRLFMQKPGCLRLTYLTGLDLVADGQRILMYDRGKHSGDSVDLDDTPLAFLLKDGRLQDAAHVASIDLRPGVTQITVRQKHDPHAGQIILFFRMRGRKPVALTHWVLTDAQGKTTQVQLTHVQTNVRVPASLFRIRKGGLFGRP